MGDAPNPFGVKLKATNNKFAQEIQSPTDLPAPNSKPPAKAAPKAAGKAAPKPSAKPPKHSPVPPARETEKLDTEPKFSPPSDPDPFKKPAKDSSLNRESIKEKEDILEVRQVHETPVMAGRDRRGENELIDTDSDDAKFSDEDNSKSYQPIEHVPKHRKSHRHRHHSHKREHQLPQPYNYMPPYNDNYRYCYYYHLPPPPPSLMKKFKEQAKSRAGYFSSPFNEKYLVPPTLLHVPGADQMSGMQHSQLPTSHNQRSFSKPGNYYM